jgi:uncharacterized protein YndB with AHSA1/START domain
MTQTVRAPAAEAYRAFTRSVALREWMCDGAVVDARPGGRLYVWWHSGYYAVGEFTALEPGRRVAFTWQGRGEPGATQVEVVLTPSGDGVEVTLTHAGFGAGDAWHKARSESQDGWTQGMENLKSVLETGQDLRYVSRPMLGIYVEEFNADIAARLGVPVSEGTRLGGVVAGLGAEQAGLRRDDVIVSIAGRPTNDYPGLVAALGPHRAGDQVAVAFYRGGERRTTEMVLSRRPIPEVPATPAELAEAVRQANASAFAELARSLEGVGEDQAARRPAAGEWNALEVLAHLIAHEREQQTWITDLLCDDERWSDRFENTEVVPARIAAIARAYPRLADMADVLRRSQGETADMLAALPAEFVAHRGTYWRLGRSMLEGVRPPNHMEEHTAQIRAAIAAP